MRAESHKTQMQHLFVENDVKSEKIQYPVECDVGNAGYSVAEKLQRHVFFEWRIEKIHHNGNPAASGFEKLSHELYVAVVCEKVVLKLCGECIFAGRYPNFW